MKAGKVAQFLFLFLLILRAFVEAHPSQERSHGALVAELRVGVLPDEAQESILKRIQPLIQYLTEETGMNIQYVRCDKYEDLLKAFHEKKVDLAWFGGYTFAKAHLQDRAIPLVMRDIDVNFTSYFLVRADHPGKTISDFKDKAIGFGSELSTSGYLMPRYFLSQMNIIPEKFFSAVRHSGKHDKTIKWVSDGTVDLGVVNSKIAERFLKEDDLVKNKVRVLWETPSYSDYVWAIHPSIGSHTQIKIREAFLNLSKENPRYKRILDQWNAHHFSQATVEDFLIIRMIVKKITQE
jgi:phosphonate transport system substrate-binding protein